MDTSRLIPIAFFIAGVLLILCGYLIPPYFPHQTPGESWSDYVSFVDSFNRDALVKEYLIQGGVGLLISSLPLTVYFTGVPRRRALALPPRFRKFCLIALAVIGIAGFAFFAIGPWVSGGGFKPLARDFVNQLDSNIIFQIDQALSSGLYGLSGFLFLLLALLSMVGYWSRDGIRLAIKKSVFYVAAPSALAMSLTVLVFDNVDFTNHAMEALAFLNYEGIYLVSNLTVMIVSLVMIGLTVFERFRITRQHRMANLTAA